MELLLDVTSLMQVMACRLIGTKPVPEQVLATVSNCETNIYHKTSNISRTVVGNKIVDNSDEVGASPVGGAPTTSSFST